MFYPCGQLPNKERRHGRKLMERIIDPSFMHVSSED